MLAPPRLLEHDSPKGVSAPVQRERVTAQGRHPSGAAGLERLATGITEPRGGAARRLPARRGQSRQEPVRDGRVRHERALHLRRFADEPREARRLVRRRGVAQPSTLHASSSSTFRRRSRVRRSERAVELPLYAPDEDHSEHGRDPAEDVERRREDTREREEDHPGRRDNGDAHGGPWMH